MTLEKVVTGCQVSDMSLLVMPPVAGVPVSPQSSASRPGSSTEAGREGTEDPVPDLPGMSLGPSRNGRTQELICFAECPTFFAKQINASSGHNWNICIWVIQPHTTVNPLRAPSLSHPLQPLPSCGKSSWQQPAPPGPKPGD